MESESVRARGRGEGKRSSRSRAHVRLQLRFERETKVSHGILEKSCAPWVFSDVSTEVGLHSKSPQDGENVVVRPEENRRTSAVREGCSEGIDERWEVQMTKLRLMSKVR